MTHRNRNLLDIAHDAPCMLQLGAPGCGNHSSVPCHSDMLRHGRGVGHKSNAIFAVAGCPSCHAVFTREHLGRAGYEEAWLRAHEKYLVYLWDNGLVRVAA